LVLPLTAHLFEQYKEISINFSVHNYAVDFIIDGKNRRFLVIK